MYNISSGNIESNKLYIVYGTQSVSYNGQVYTTGQNFKGITSISTFTFFGSGTQIVYEVLELKGGEISFALNALDVPIFLEMLILKGCAIEYVQTANDIEFGDLTALNGFAMELLDYPFYSFTITETRL
jgi:hypothetical protein